MEAANHDRRTTESDSDDAVLAPYEVAAKSSNRTRVTQHSTSIGRIKVGIEGPVPFEVRASVQKIGLSDSLHLSKIELERSISSTCMNVPRRSRRESRAERGISNFTVSGAVKLSSTR